MYPLSIRVAIDVGSTCHRVAIGLPDGKMLDEFDIEHNAGGFKEFFCHIERFEKRHQLPVAVDPNDLLPSCLRMYSTGRATSQQTARQSRLSQEKPATVTSRTRQSCRAGLPRRGEAGHGL